MKTEREIQKDQVPTSLTRLSGWSQNRKPAQPDSKTRAEQGKLVWKGSPLSKELLMRLIERVQES